MTRLAFFYSICIIILAVCLVCMIFSYQRLLKEHRRLKKNLEEREIRRRTDEQSLISLKQAEYLALQNQINPHFLYNTLEAIRGDAICEGMHNIANTTKALSTFFRYTITDVGNSVVLEDEINNVENYFTIQKYRFDDKLNMDIEIQDQNEELLHAQIPKLTLQPIVENAISHGLEHKVGDGTVKILVDYTDKTLWITVEDDGVGIEEERLLRLNERLLGKELPENIERPKKGGIALVNVNSRIKLLYGEDYGMQIYSSPGVGTTVKVNLPLDIGHKGS